MTTPILLGKTAPPELKPIELASRVGNRHGLVAGATGTGKTVSLMTLAEGFSRIGVPVFLADVKGDVAGLAMPGTANERVRSRLDTLGITDHAPEANPVVFWDLFGAAGHPVRTTVSEIGPILLSRMLELNDTQSGVLDIAFRLADDQGLLLLDLEDLRAVLVHLAERRKEVSTQYGLVSAPSIAAIQRALLRLESDGGARFFGEPALELSDLMRTTTDGRGVIGVLAADSLVLRPRLYSTFLLWLLSELFEQLPEVGDLDKPRLVFIFDEAHLLFDDATPALRQRVEQVVRLIRSKGVGVYFCSQFPDDVPGEILGQLGNRVQHALRAFTPRDQKAVRVAAETFVPNPAIDVTAALTQLAIGEALVSLLSAEGVPAPVERVLIAPPRSRIGPITAEERQQVRASSPVGAKYDAPLDRESAAELLARRAEQAASVAAAPPAKAAPRASNRQGLVETMAKQAARTVGSQIGRQIVRGLLGGLFGGRGR
ncbi:helicase HerA-like domain-containing protein [Cognatilysobacter segetis]|uniref:helicase HerA-like domain-containing protein n=1 Tax=Cognatilysobacter segetis TaxID=2492394 RepID=UPI0010615FA6|nr:helicase HerA-like domain-containing protein [Lysobacter segetis]